MVVGDKGRKNGGGNRGKEGGRGEGYRVTFDFYRGWVDGKKEKADEH